MHKVKMLKRTHKDFLYICGIIDLNNSVKKTVFNIFDSWFKKKGMNMCKKKYISFPVCVSFLYTLAVNSAIVQKIPMSIFKFLLIEDNTLIYFFITMFKAMVLRSKWTIFIFLYIYSVFRLNCMDVWTDLSFKSDQCICIYIYKFRLYIFTLNLFCSLCQYFMLWAVKMSLEGGGDVCFVPTGSCDLQLNHKMNVYMFTGLFVFSHTSSKCYMSFGPMLHTDVLFF